MYSHPLTLILLISCSKVKGKGDFSTSTPPPRSLFPSPPMSLSFESESEAGRRFHEAKLILNPPQVDLKVKAGSEPVNNFPALIEILCKKTTRVRVSFHLNSYFEHKPVKMKEKRVKTTKN